MLHNFLGTAGCNSIQFELLLYPKGVILTHMLSTMTRAPSDSTITTESGCWKPASVTFPARHSSQNNFNNLLSKCTKN